MASELRQIDPKKIKENTFKLISSCMLVTAGAPGSFNTMTAGWGGLGVIWSKDICFCLIRPVRYTYAFMERSNSYSLCFFEEKYRDALTLCGSKSGREVDKVAQTGLTPVLDDGPTYFEQARLVFQCTKIYFHDLIPANFRDAGIESFYPQKDYHRMYFGEITRALSR